MKVKEFIEMYQKSTRMDIAKQLEVKKYVGIAYKREMAKLVLDNCTSIIDGEVHIDSIERYILFVLSVISMHTNLEFSIEEDDESSAIDDYDALCESGLLVKIIETFQEDYTSCQEILNMMTSDRLQDNMTIEKKIYKFLDAIANIFGNSTDKLVEKLNLDSLDFSKFDQGDLVKLFDLVKDK